MQVREKLISRRELADHLNVKYLTVHYLTKTGKIPFIVVGGRYRYRLNDVMAALEKNEIAKGVCNV